jgi:hypothetical protein
MRFHHHWLLLAACMTVVAVYPARARAQANCEKLDKQSLARHTPKDWGELHQLFRKFGTCDDGAIGEQFSEDVAQLFSRQWAHVNQLDRLGAADKAFERFVLRHIDATLDESELLLIVDNAKLHCRAGDGRICGLVFAKAQASLDTLRDLSE